MAKLLNKYKERSGYIQPSGTAAANIGVQDGDSLDGPRREGEERGILDILTILEIFEILEIPEVPKILEISGILEIHEIPQH